MHEFAQRGIASHWKYKSSEKFSDLSWKEYDWLRDLVEIIEAGTSPEHYYEFTKLQMFQENVFCFTPKGAVIKLPKMQHQLILLMLFIQKLEIVQLDALLMEACNTSNYFKKW